MTVKINLHRLAEVGGKQTSDQVQAIAAGAWGWGLGWGWTRVFFVLYAVGLNALYLL